MTQSSGTLLEERGDDYHAKLARQLPEKLGGWPGDGLGKVEEVHVLRLAEIKTVVKFLQHYEPRALLGKLPALVGKALLVLVNVGSVVLLYNTYFQFHVRKGFNLQVVFYQALGQLHR